MKRIVWIAVTILIMIGIMGFGLYTMRRIDRVNQERREKEEGEKFASQIVVMTGTTSIWDKVRSGQETTTVVTDENGNVIVPTDAYGAPATPTEQTEANDMAAATDAPVEMQPASEAIQAETLAPVPQDNGFAAPDETPREQTTVEPIVITLD